MSIVIIGGGQAATSCAVKYRALGGTEPVTIISTEPYYPYQRPPLSKKYLSGEMELERLFLRPPAWYDENGVAFEGGVEVTAIDLAAKIVRADEREFAYGKLVLATGSRPRLLPESLTGGAKKGIYAMRSIADVDAMREEFQAGRKLLIIGGGYVGLEAAAVARKFDVDVTLVEAAPRILGRVASKATADFIRGLHQGHGVEVLEGIGIVEIIRQNGRATGAKLTDGRDLAADFIIVGIGIIPNTEIAEAAGLVCDEGILVDAHCRTSDEDVFAAGDCTRIHHQDQLIRIESVGNAIDQGEVVAANLAGQLTPYQPRPWFWSDQYDMTLQIAGLNVGYDATIVRSGSKEGAQSVWYYRDDQLIAVDAINEPRAYMIGKRIIEAGKTLPQSVAADAGANLKAWM